MANPEIPTKIRFFQINKESQREKALRLALKWKIKDIYLLEGFEKKNPRFKNFMIAHNNKLIGLLHVRGGMFTHLYFGVSLNSSIVYDLRFFLKHNFPDTEFIFSHGEIINQILTSAIFNIKRHKDFYFMEVDKSSLIKHGRGEYCIPSTSSAQKLLPLFMKYETEELNVDHTYSDRAGLLLVVRKKLKRGEITTVCDEGKTIGIAGINARFNGISQIGYVYVLPEYRGMGYGKRLISSHVERLLQECSKVVLFVRKENVPAYRLYISCGFKVTGTLAQIWLG